MIVSPSCSRGVRSYSSCCCCCCSSFSVCPCLTNAFLIWGIDAKTAEVSQSAPAFLLTSLHQKKTLLSQLLPLSKHHRRPARRVSLLFFQFFFVKKKKKQKKRRRRRKNTAGTYAQCSQLGCHFDLLSLVLTSEAFEKNKNALARTRALTHPALCYCRVVRWLTKFWVRLTQCELNSTVQRGWISRTLLACLVNAAAINPLAFTPRQVTLISQHVTLNPQMWQTAARHPSLL